MMILKELDGAVEATQAILEKIEFFDFPTLIADGRAGPSSAAGYLDAANRFLRGQSFTDVPVEILGQSELCLDSSEPGKFRFDVDLWVDGIESDLTATFYAENHWNGVKVCLYTLRVL